MTAERPAPKPPPARPPASAPSNPPVGLAGLRAHLDRVVHRHGLRSLLVVIDDPDLGRQAFRAGAGAVGPGAVASGPGVTSDPPLPPGALDGEMLTALCAMSLQLELLGESGGEPDDDAELALRSLPGVYAVVIEHDGDLTLCHVLAASDAPEDVARRAADAIGPSAGAKVVVELRRDPPPGGDAGPQGAPGQPDRVERGPRDVQPAEAPSIDWPPSPSPSPSPARPDTDVPAAPSAPSVTEMIRERFADATWSEDALASRPASAPRPAPAAAPAAPAPPAPGVPTLLSVRSVPEDGDIEAHVAVGTLRSVGRAPLSRGLAGAAEAVLAAVGQVDASLEGWTPTWVRTVETTADGKFVVAASLGGPTGEQRHGIATGHSPIDGAAHATALAIAEPPADGGAPSTE